MGNDNVFAFQAKCLIFNLLIQTLQFHTFCVHTDTDSIGSDSVDTWKCVFKKVNRSTNYVAVHIE